VIDIALAAIPNQSLSIRLEDRLYNLTLWATRGVMSADIERDGVFIVRGARIVAGTPLIPYRYLESGNFVMLTENEEYPDYALFGISQSLVYVTIAELEALRDE
jgi:hypothetical protein